jgi:hypothetical protein
VAATCSDLSLCLATIAQQRLRNGCETGRGLSKRAGLSQAHVCNWLAGKRSLSPASCDLVMAALRVTIPDLLAVQL